MHPWIASALVALQGQAPAPEVMVVAASWFYHFDPQTGAIQRIVPNVHPTLDVYGMTYNGSRLVAIDRGILSVPLDEVVDIHPSDGSLTKHGLTGYAWNIATIEFDPTTGIYWATHGGDLYTIDISTGAAHFVGPIQGLKMFDCICGLAIDKQGNAFGLGYVGGAFYSLDLPNASATLLGDLPFFTSAISDAAFDSSGRLFATYRGGSVLLPHGVYEIDIANVSANLFIPNILATGLAFVPATPEAAYCASKTNSQGCDATLTSLGLASPTAAFGYEVTASNVANQTNGRLLYSVVGGASNPFAGGTWCVAGPWNGSTIVSSGGTPKPAVDCSGSWTVDMNTVLSQKPGPQAGDTVYCQWIGRDVGFAAPDNYALSSALEFTLLP